MQMTNLTNSHIVMQLLKTQSHVFYAGEHCGDWRSAPPESQRCVFHLVTQGQCHMQVHENESMELQQGEVALFLQPTAHYLQASSSQPTQLLCGYMEFINPLSAAIVQQLPSHVRYNTQQNEGLKHVMALIQLEVQSQDEDQRMQSVLLPQLCDLLLAYVLRDLMAQPVNKMSYGLMSLAQDSVYGELLQRLWQNPAQAWDVAQMADVVHASKASFHRRLRMLTGLSPAQLLSTIRLHWAQHYLQQSLSVEQTAERVGYNSASTLTQVFKRELGMSPTQWREQHLVGQAPRSSMDQQPT